MENEEVVIIKPSKKSRKFIQDAKMLQGVMTRNADGTMSDNGETKELGTFNKERFNGSRQILRGPAWSGSKQEYNFGDISNEELNKLVEQVGFFDDKGNKITSCDRRRIDDPFINHKDFKVLFNEGEVEMTPAKDALDKILLLGFKARTTMNGMSGGPTSSRTKWEIVDKNKTTVHSNSAIDLWTEIASLFKVVAEDEPKLRKIAAALYLGVSDQTTYPIVKSTMGKALMADGDVKVKNSNETVKEAFIRLAKGPTDHLNTSYYVAVAIKKGFLRKRQNQGWLYNGKPIATTEAQVVEYFLDATNQEDFFELERLVGDNTKQNITSGAGQETEQDSE